MPKRELNQSAQVEQWLRDWGSLLSAPGSLTLIGSAGLLWHAGQRGASTLLPENSMDADPVTDDEEVARLCYDAIIGSEFERERGWHVNLMPRAVLRELPQGWESRASRAVYGRLEVVVPSPADLLAPKLRRDEPRDRAHHAWALGAGLLEAR